MLLRYSFAACPNVGQRKRAARVFGCSRWVWNAALAAQLPVKASNKLLGNPRERIAEGPYARIPRNPDLSKTLITEAKKTPERAWLAQAPAGVLQQSLRDLDKAWTAHEDSRSGKRPGPKIEEPRFKSKHDRRQCARFTRATRFKILPNGRLRLPNIGELKVKWTRELPADPSSVTLIRDEAGRYWVSVVVESDPTADLLPQIDTDCGIDLGLKHFAVLDSGQKIDHPTWLKRAEKKLKKAQRALSRKAKGSRNRAKARVEVARQHAHVANCRRDWQHKLSTRTIGENQAVYVETLHLRSSPRPTWPSPSTTARLRSSCRCWSTRPRRPDDCSSRWTETSPPPSGAPPANTAPDPRAWPDSGSASGPATTAPPCTTETSTPASTSRPRAAASGQP